MGSKGHKHHQISLKNLHEDEQILHNCSSHSSYHLKIHLPYLFGLLIPVVGLTFLSLSNVANETIITAWFLFTCFGLMLTTYYFIKGVNFELGGCVITNQRVLRFGYTGLFQTVEREILPKNIEDFKIVKRGLMSFFFNTANIYIYTANRQTDVLKFIIDPEKVSESYSVMMRSYSNQPYSQSSAHPHPNPSPSKATVIDNIKLDNLERHKSIRQDILRAIAKVFRK